jgi:hypothetical protein
MAASARAHHRGYRRSVVTGGVNRCERQASISEHHRRTRAGKTPLTRVLLCDGRYLAPHAAGG